MLLENSGNSDAPIRCVLILSSEVAEDKACVTELEITDESESSNPEKDLNHFYSNVTDE